MSENNRKPPSATYTAEELLAELFGERGEGKSSGGKANRETALGLYPVADGRLALVHGAQLAEFTPLSGGARRALHCDLCHVTRSPSEARIYRVVVADRRARYVTLCGTEACQQRAGMQGLERLAQHIFPVQSGAEML